METLETRYQKALDYIYSFVDYSRTHHDQLTQDDFSLDRMQAFVREIGSPADDFPILHIAGSKGKGSVSALCASALQAAGLRVGLYTSPHLKDFEERMQVSGRPIPRRDLVYLLDEVKPAIESLPYLTTFEIMTGLALLFFSRREVDIAVVEVGLGGRLDLTNVLSPILPVITALFLDHTSILCDTIQEIAREKGGIIKPGVPVIVAPQEKEAAKRTLQEIAARQDAPLHFVDREYQYQIEQVSLEGQFFQVLPSQHERGKPETFSIPLLGSYQVDNAVTAYAALQELQERGFSLSSQDIRSGFQEVDWPGRFEVLRSELPVIVDSAHNPASCRYLRRTVDQFFPDHPGILIFGISADKQLEGMLDELLPRMEAVITTHADHPRAMEAEALAEIISRRGKPVESISSVKDALKRGLSWAGEDHLILITGSIFVAASARIAWEEMEDDPQGKA